MSEKMRRILDRFVRGVLIMGSLLTPGSWPGFMMHASQQQKIAQQQEYSDKTYYQRGIELYQNAVKEEKEVAHLIRRALVGDALRKYILLANTFQKLNANNTIDNIIEEVLKARDAFETVISDNHIEYADVCLFMMGESSSLISKLFTDVYGVTAGSRIQSARDAREKIAKSKLDEIGIEGKGLFYTYNCDAYRELLERHPESEWADNAQFRLNNASMSSEGYEGAIRARHQMTFGPKPIIVEGEAEDSLKIWLPFIEKYPESELKARVLLRIAVAYHTLAGYDGILGGFSPTRYDIQGIIDRSRWRGTIRDEKGELQEIVYDRMSYINESYLDKALNAYKQVIADYARSESAVVAQYYIGVVHELGYRDKGKAIDAYKKVIGFYPDAVKFGEDALLVRLANDRIKRLGK